MRPLAYIPSKRKQHALLKSEPAVQRLDAFTMLEMLVAIGIFFVIMVLLVEVFASNIKIWKSVENQSGAMRESRAFLSFIKQDISSAYLPETSDAAATFPWICFKPHPNQGSEEKDQQSVFFFSRSESSHGDDLSAVGYFTKWNEERKSFVLYHYKLPPDLTFERIRSNASAATDTAFQEIFTEAYDTESPYVAELAAYVFDVTVRESNHSDGVASPENYAYDFPDWVELRWRVLSPEGLRMLQNSSVTPETWLDKSSPQYENIIKRYEMSYITRIPLSRSSS